MKKILIYLCCFVILTLISCTAKEVPVIDAPITDEAALIRIIMRINQEGVYTLVKQDGVVMVQGKKTARNMLYILVEENLLPEGVSPWQLFEMKRWKATDF